jgi:hypothetical protein
MNFLKIKLLVIAVIMFAASSAFASLIYDVNVNTSSLAGDTAYLYLQYDTINKAVASTATVTSFNTNGVLGAQDTVDVVDGSAVTGTLPDNVVFANTNTINDYNQAITLGNSLNFLVTFVSTPSSANPTADSTFSLGIFADALGNTPLLNVNDPNVPGTVAEINLYNNGNTSAQSLDASTEVNPVPEPGTMMLFVAGLMGLVGIRTIMQSST